MRAGRCGPPPATRLRECFSPKIPCPCGAPILAATAERVAAIFPVPHEYRQLSPEEICPARPSCSSNRKAGVPGPTVSEGVALDSGPASRGLFFRGRGDGRDRDARRLFTRAARDFESRFAEGSNVCGNEE